MNSLKLTKVDTQATTTCFSVSQLHETITCNKCINTKVSKCLLSKEILNRPQNFCRNDIQNCRQSNHFCYFFRWRWRFWNVLARYSLYWLKCCSIFLDGLKKLKLLQIWCLQKWSGNKNTGTWFFLIQSVKFWKKYVTYFWIFLYLNICLMYL